MVTGVSFDFHSFSISWISESSQWWRSMAVVVIFGLMVATFLTLLVVPTLYYLFEQLSGYTRVLVNSSGLSIGNLTHILPVNLW